MFPIGTILYIKDAGLGAIGADHCIGEVVSTSSSNHYRGATMSYNTKNSFCVKILYNDLISKSPRLLANVGEYWIVKSEGQYIEFHGGNGQDLIEWYRGFLVAEKLAGKL